jgi:dolichol-phosphate mannosyltransferase
MSLAEPPKRVLLTGGTGFVGANLARRLLSERHQVTLLVRPGHERWRLADVEDRLRWREAELDDRPALERLLAEVRPQWVFHLAAHGAYSWQTDPLAIMRTNVMGTACLVEACLAAGFEAFVNTGSSSEYGLKDHPPSEDEAPAPNSRYAVGKAAATLYCTQAAMAAGAPITTLRLYSVYGPWEDPRRFIAQLVAQGLAGRLPPLASPETARDYVHVDDVCDAYLAAAARNRRPGAVYNVGSGVQTTLRQAVEAARRRLEIEAVPDWGSMPDRVWDTAAWVSDSSRLRRELGWRPAVDLEAGLLRTADWFRANPGLLYRYLAPSTASASWSSARPKRRSR